MAIVAITSNFARNARRYQEAVAGHAETCLLTPGDAIGPPQCLLEGVGGLLLPGGADISPHLYGASTAPESDVKLCRDLDDLELGLLRYALDQDMPVLAICRGMQLLNIAFGGSLIQDIPGHRAVEEDGASASVPHSIYLSPGAKLAAILGMGGFFCVNSRHHQGLREAQKSPKLLASAYSLEDGIIEGLESPQHSWVVGVQCHPERQDEVPKVFANLFVAFAERAEAYGGASPAR